MTAPLLDVRDLSLSYRSRQAQVPVLHQVQFALSAGQTLGLVGESGSGKSQIALALMGLLPAHAQLQGQVFFEGRDVLLLRPRQRRALRGARMGLIFQDPMTSLNPYLRIGLQLAEVLEQHEGSTRARALAEARQMLDAVQIPEAGRRLAQYPHELSGGQRQRVMIAMMLLAKPALLIADEPTTALDATVQAGILRLLAALQKERQLALLLISHDLDVIARLADQLMVLYAGRVVEQGSAAAVLHAPAHPYTQALLRCRPRLDAPLHQALTTIPGQPARAAEKVSGCPFAPRCESRQAECLSTPPNLRRSADGRYASCHYS